jgi:hypothetical protein
VTRNDCKHKSVKRKVFSLKMKLLLVFLAFIYFYEFSNIPTMKIISHKFSDHIFCFLTSSISSQVCVNNPVKSGSKIISQDEMIQKDEKRENFGTCKTEKSEKHENIEEPVQKLPVNVPSSGIITTKTFSKRISSLLQTESEKCSKIIRNSEKAEQTVVKKSKSQTKTLKLHKQKKCNIKAQNSLTKIQKRKQTEIKHCVKEGDVASKKNLNTRNKKSSKTYKEKKML